MTDLFNTILIYPMTNILLLFSQGLWGYFGLAVIALTVIVRGLIFPLTWRQLQSTKAMMALQPKLKELQKKYGKDKRKLSEETMKLYQEHKISPLGCLFPMLVQLPIFIALFFSIRHIVIATEISAVEGIYGWSVLHQGFPSMHFLWIDLAQSGDLGLGVLVMLSMYMLQKMSTMPSVDPKQQQMQRIMVLVFPLMMGIISISLPGGLGLYFLVSNIIGVIMQYFVTGWGTLRLPEPIRERIPVDRLPTWMKRTGTANPASTKQERAQDGKHRENSQDSG